MISTLDSVQHLRYRKSRFTVYVKVNITTHGLNGKIGYNHEAHNDKEKSHIKKQ